MKNPLYIKDNLDCLVVSSGGVGTTLLIKQLSTYITCNCPDNSDGYKHMLIPPINRPELKVIYIYGDPVVATISLFRRKYHRTLSLIVKKYILDNPTLEFNLTVADYAKMREDIMHLESHFDNWHEKYQRHQTLYLSYETLFDNLEVIRDFLSLNDEFIVEFPPYIERKSRLESIPKEVLDLLGSTYGKLRDKQNALMSPVIKKKKTFNFPFRYLVYRRTLYHYIMTKTKILRRIKAYLNKKS